MTKTSLATREKAKEQLISFHSPKEMGSLIFLKLFSKYIEMKTFVFGRIGDEIHFIFALILRPD